MTMRHELRHGLYQRGGIGAFFLGIIFCLVIVYLVSSRTEGSRSARTDSDNNIPRAVDSTNNLASAHPTSMPSNDDIAEIFSFNSNFTDLHRQIKTKEILGKVVEWRLPVYEVRQSGAEYIIDTSASERNGILFSGNESKNVKTSIHVVPANENELRRIESLKTGDSIKFRGVISDITLRILIIRPAILVEDVLGNPITKQPSETKASLNSILHGRLLDSEISKFESIFGPALRAVKVEGGKSGFSSMREYEIDKCTVYVQLKGNEIAKITVLADKCGATLDGYKIPLRKMQFSNFIDSQTRDGTLWGRFEYECLRFCSNSHNPETTFVFGGSHAENFIYQYVNGFPSNESELIEAIEKNEGPDAVSHLTFDARSYDKLAATLYATTKVWSYSIGR